MTLEEDIKRLAELRRKKAEIDEEIKVSREAWMDENAGKILAASVAGDLVDEMEEKVRAALENTPRSETAPQTVGKLPRPSGRGVVTSSGL